MSSVPADLLYSAEHEWVSGDVEPGSVVTVGITEHAAKALGDVVFVELPSVGDKVTAGEVCGELESSKAVSELYSPVSGTVTAVNEALNDAPAAINDEPYESGWIFKVDVSEDVELLDSDAYSDHIA
ncbi:glycine cleavage system protein GcvH [Demequina sp. TTPB684]|uniref:glycine cleavage system protein GcvH n=1 Tax=unclassified Demequina TaxID=2620311 RepID=UPI001CF4A2D9|nr:MULTISPECIES: glycine cleavage system protein GcvH [unclassified Demequina]MCB2412720.1 glycine cleavage system protein GcvH [Demequina sp. TTPB684]UPU87843.1 glycine cleavage system protein GcvH [Demequina sp. TMPB413]